MYKPWTKINMRPGLSKVEFCYRTFFVSESDGNIPWNIIYPMIWKILQYLKVKRHDIRWLVFISNLFLFVEWNYFRHYLHPFASNWTTLRLSRTSSKTLSYKSLLGLVYWSSLIIYRLDTWIIQFLYLFLQPVLIHQNFRSLLLDHHLLAFIQHIRLHHFYKSCWDIIFCNLEFDHQRPHTQGTEAPFTFDYIFKLFSSIYS